MGIFNSIFKPNVNRLANGNNVEGLINCIKNEDEQIKNDACKAFREMELRDVQAVNKLCIALKDDNINVKINASLGLGLAMGKLGIFSIEKKVANNFYRMAPTTIESLMIILKDKDSRVRSMGAVALSQLSPSYDSIAVNALFLLLKDSDKDVKASATAALYFWAIESKDPRYLHELEDKNSIAYKSNKTLNISLNEKFKETDFIASFPKKIDQIFLKPFKGRGLNSDVEEELGMMIQVSYEKYKKSIELSKSNTISIIANEFYRKISEYWKLYFDGKDLA